MTPNGQLATGTSSDAVILAHVSDIHFHRARGADEYTIDDDLRRELQHALGTLADELKAMHGILITGDIAFSGAAEEYERAYSWIREVCKRTRCPEESVRTISGNHDVQRAAAKGSRLLQTMHADLRRKGAASQFAEIDEEIRGLLSDPAAPDLLFNGIRNYNDFADKFLCGFHPTQPYWQQDVLLNDGSILRIRGLNSALVSDASDNTGDNKLVLGPTFTVLPRAENVEYLVMCHHPPQWLWDNDPIEDYLSTRARIVLFGHKHVQRIGTTKRDGHEVLRIHAGALNPDPGQSRYEPRFNCLRLVVRKKDDRRQLHVDVYQRVWSEEKTRFVSANEGGKECDTFELDLGEWKEQVVMVEASTGAGMTDPTEAVSDPLTIRSKDSKDARALSAPRRLAYRFMALPYHVRLETAQKLNLLSDEDRGQSDVELFRRFFRRAGERSQLAALWKETESQYSDSQADQNPFES